VSCECGKTLNVKDNLEGKRIKCPDCKESLMVSEAGSDVRKKKNRKGNGAGKGKQGMLFAVLGLVLLSGCCCLGGTGLGAWWFWPSGSSAELEKKIIGKWISDIEPPKKGAKVEDLMKQALGGGMIEFKPDGTVIDASPMTPILSGKWKTVTGKGDVLTVELSDSRNSVKLDIKLVSDDSVKITPIDSKQEFAFKRSSK
jgi:hypothetical protein